MSPNRPIRPRNRLWPCAAVGAALMLAASCAKREEAPPAAATASKSKTAAAVPRAPATAPAIPEAPAAPASGADLDQVALNAAAFSDLVDSLRKYAGKEIATNAATLDLEAFVQGKSAQEILTFAEMARYKSPYAVLQVLDYLWRQDLDTQLRIEVAERFGELAYEFGYAKDRARAYECMDWLIGVLGDPGQAAAMSDAERRDLLRVYDGLSVSYGIDASATCKKRADALRRTARSDLDRAKADEFEAFALLNTGQQERIPAARAILESLRARGDPNFAWVDHWLSLDDATVAAEFRKLKDIDARFRIDEQRRFQRLDSLPPAERMAEMRRQNEAAETNPPAQMDSP